MKGEKQGVSAWLRGIIDECGVSGTQSCTAIAKAFGIDCKHERTCRDCIAKMMTTIADRIDAERALPEGVEWPRFEVGELVKAGDEVEYGEEAMRVRSVTFVANGWSLRCERRGVDGVLYGSFGERVKRPAPKVLDADGVQIKVGDTVYFVDGAGVRHAVKDIIFEPGGPFVGIIDEKVRCPLMVNPDTLTHERPDSWEKLEEDARKTACDYAPAPRNEDGLTTCDGCPFQKSESCSNEMTIDLVERAKKLAGIEEEARNGD